MKRLLSLALPALFLPAASAAETPRPLRPVSTYSIVARDPETGEMGVAVQSHWFSVGSVVLWAEAGVGAVATQSFVDPAYGPLGLEMMRAGRSAEETLSALLHADEGREVRQVAMVDRHGGVAAHTGGKCIHAAGHTTGPQFSTQANLMQRPTVWPAMAEAYRASEGDLAERLLAALEAAEAEGGDIRGRQSAAILIVSAESSGRPWKDRRFDLRVEDHPDPVGELRRLVTMQRAYRKLNEGDDLVTLGRMDAALEAYREATTLLPDKATNGEAAFWVGISLANAGNVEEAHSWLRRASRQDRAWIELVPRLSEVGLLPDDDELIRTLVRKMRR